MEIGSFVQASGLKGEVGIISMPVDYGLPLTREAKARIHEEFLKDLSDVKPKGVGISCTAIAQAEEVISLCELIKRHDPEIFVFLGGYFPTIYYEEILARTPSVDLIVLGEGELPTLMLIDRLRKGQSPYDAEIPNAVWKRSGEIHGPFKMVSFDLHRKALLDLGLLRFPMEYDVLPYAFSRGCAYRCDFCMEGSIRPRRREVPAELVQEDLTNLFRQSQAQTLLISDALFTSFEKLEMLKGFGMKANFETRCDVMDVGVIPKIADICGILAMGLESASYNTLRRMNKVKSKEHYRRYMSNALAIFREAARNRIPMMVFMIAGYPGDTEEDLEESLRFAKRLSEYAGIGGHVFKIGECRVYPKTKLHTTASSMPEVVFDDQGVFGDNIVRRPSRNLDFETVLAYMKKIFSLSNNTPKLETAISKVMPLFRIPVKAFQDKIIPDNCFQGNTRDTLNVQGESLESLRKLIPELRKKYQDLLPDQRKSRELSI
jgi:hypothetical protein